MTTGIPSAPRLTLSTTFGLGHLRPAPGTWGSLPPVALAVFLLLLGIRPDTTPVLFAFIFLLVALVFTLVCVLQGDAAEARFGRKDPSEVVADETAGQAVALMAVPVVAASAWGSFGWIVLSFFLFRLADILKPLPASRLQHVPGGWGIVLDDLVAGLYAGLGVLLIMLLIAS